MFLFPVGVLLGNTSLTHLHELSFTCASHGKDGKYTGAMDDYIIHAFDNAQDVHRFSCEFIS